MPEVNLLMEALLHTSKPLEPIVPRPRYSHIGALITDAVLQAGLRYDTVVRPRVLRLIRCWPSAYSTSAFLRKADNFGLEGVLAWKGHIKLRRIIDLAVMLRSAQVESVDDLGTYLTTPDGRASLEDLAGIGPKTIDYISMLAGLDAIAVDRHLLDFVRAAGVTPKGYSHAQHLISAAAAELAVNLTTMDRWIWSLGASRLQ